MFPNQARIRWLIQAVLMGQNEEWQLQYRYRPQHVMKDHRAETDHLRALTTTLTEAPLSTMRH